MNNATQGIPQNSLSLTGTSRKLLAAMALISILGASGSAMADPRPPYGHDRYGYDDYRDYRPHWKHRHIHRAPPVVVVSPPVQRYYYYEPAPVIITPPPPPPSGLSLIVPLYFR